jgi:hypothetical protein
MVRKSVSGTARFSDSPLAPQAPPDASPSRLHGQLADVILTDLAAACEARRQVLTGAFDDPDVLADRLAIAAEERLGGAT